MKRVAVVTALILIAAGCSSSHSSTAPSTTIRSLGHPAPAKAAEPAPVVERAADAGDLHYKLELATPTVGQHGLVREVLQVGNGTDHVVTLDACLLDDISISDQGHTRSPTVFSACGGGRVRIRGQHSFTYGAVATAPARVGAYAVSLARVFRHALPASLLAPLDLRVTASDRHLPATSCTEPDLRTHGPVGMPAPRVVTAPVTFDFGGPGTGILEPPAPGTRAIVSAQQAWKRAQRSSFLPISPLGTYQLLLALYSPIQSPPNQLVWVFVARHAPQMTRTLGLVGPTGPSGPPTPPCFFTDGALVFSATNLEQGYGGVTGTLHTS